MSEKIYRLIRWGLALIFFYAGAGKLFDPQSFAVIIEAYGIIPESLLMPIAVLLPGLEVIAAVGLLFDVRGSLGTICFLLIVFIVILGYAIHMGLDVDCGCFGPEDPESRAYAGIRPALYRDILMMAGIIYLYAWRFSRTFQPVRLVPLLNNYLKEKI
ncbi:MauE/DoxX family redox-associated membrane protein [Desulfobacterales bacterium HSG17]|nr:MauE/DoxX family redox-associated membrane protein [Desulfobacterales bacterium HSG17]